MKLHPIQPPQRGVAPPPMKKKNRVISGPQPLKIGVPKSLAKFKAKIREFVSAKRPQVLDTELEDEVRSFLKELTKHDYVTKLVDDHQLNIFEHEYTSEVQSKDRWSDLQTQTLASRILKE